MKLEHIIALLQTESFRFPQDLSNRLIDECWGAGEEGFEWHSSHKNMSDLAGRTPEAVREAVADWLDEIEMICCQRSNPKQIIRSKWDFLVHTNPAGDTVGFFRGNFPHTVQVKRYGYGQSPYSLEDMAKQWQSDSAKMWKNVPPPADSPAWGDNKPSFEKPEWNNDRPVELDNGYFRKLFKRYFTR